MNRILDLFRKRRQPLSESVRSMIGIGLIVVGAIYTPIVLLFSVAVHGLTNYIVFGFTMLFSGILIISPLYVAKVRRRKNLK